MIRQPPVGVRLSFRYAELSLKRTVAIESPAVTAEGVRPLSAGLPNESARAEEYLQSRRLPVAERKREASLAVISSSQISRNRRR